MHRPTFTNAWRAAGLAALTSAAFAPMAAAAPVVQPFQTIPHGDGDSNARNLVTNGGRTFFVADDGTHGTEPFVVSAGGTATLLADLSQGSDDTSISAFTPVGDLTYFVASTQDGTHLWVTDGTPGGTHVVAGAATQSIQDLTASGGTLYARGSVSGGAENVIFRVDPSTGHLEDIAEFDDYLDRILPGPGGGIYVFSWTIAGNGYPIFHPNFVAPDGTTHAFSHPDENGDPQAYVAEGSGSAATAGGLLYWVDTDGTVQASSPTGDTTTQVTDDGDPLPTDTSTSMLAAGDGSVLIQGTDHLFRATGTDASSVAAMSDSSLGGAAFVVGGKLFYARSGSIKENDLSGATSTSTTVSPSGGYANELTASGDAVYFAFSPNNGPANIYRSTGGAAVPQLAADQFMSNSGFGKASSGDGVDNLTARAGGGVVFTATTRALGNELFVTPATAGGQAPNLADVNAQPRYVYMGGDTGSTASFGGGKALFSVYDGFTDQPWVSDGTPAGTHALLPAADASREISKSTAFGDKVVFVMNDDATRDTGVFISDGTAEGTHSVIPDTDTFAITGGKIYAIGSGDTTNTLVSSDGTAAGTSTIAAPTGAPDDWYPYEVVAAGSHVYVSAQSSTDSSANGLWAYDTAAHSWEHVSDAYFNLRDAKAAGSKLYAPEYSTYGPKVVWASDGTAAGTHVLNLESSPTSNRNYDAQVFVSGDTAFAITEADGSGEYPTAHLWKIDDSAHSDDPSHKDGVQVQSTADVNLDALSRYAQFTSGPGGIYGTSNGVLYRVGNDGAVTSLHAFGAQSERSTVELYGSFATGNTLYFSADDGDHGTEPWSTDGTAAGTAMLADTIAGPTSGYPNAYAYAGGQLLFSIDKGDGGAIYSYGEPLSTPTPTATPVPTPAPTPVQTATPEPAGAAATPTPAPKPAATPAPTPVDPRPVPRKVSGSADVLASTKSAYRVSLAGSVLGAAGLSSKAQCRGQVEVVVTATKKGKKGKKVVTTIGTYKLKLTWTGGKCTYDKVLRIAKKDVPSGATVQAVVTFRGSSTQAPKTGQPITLDIG